MIDRQLAGHNRRAAIVSILDNLKDVATLLGRQRGEAPIIESRRAQRDWMIGALIASPPASAAISWKSSRIATAAAPS